MNNSNRTRIPTSSFTLRALSRGLACAGLLVGACGDDGGHDHDHGPDSSLSTAVTLDFGAFVGAEAFSCAEGAEAKSFTGLGTSAVSASLKDFRLYVSNIKLLDASGAATAMSLTTDGLWQVQTASDGHVALLDFEDGTQNCTASGNTPMNAQIIGTVPNGTYTGIEFDIGVPFGLNHLDVDSVNTEPPLNVGNMMWVWASGHKFARIDFDPGEIGGDDVWNFHLGSTMCMSTDMTTPPTAECMRPNRATVRLESFDFESDTIKIDAAALVADSDLSQNLGTPTPGCMTFPHDEDDCAPLFPNLGMSYTTGACDADCAAQTVFSVEAQ